MFVLSWVAVPRRAGLVIIKMITTLNTMSSLKSNLVGGGPGAGLVVLLVVGVRAVVWEHRVGWDLAGHLWRRECENSEKKLDKICRS